MKAVVIIFLGAALSTSLIGCETLKGVSKGASEGFKKDWKKVQPLDDWMEEHMW